MVSGVRRLFAWAALVAFMATFGFGPVIPGHAAGDDDAGCNLGAVAGHDSAQFETVKPAVTASHCPFCHWQRVVSSASLGSAVGAVIELQPADRVPAATSDRIPSVCLSGKPPRGPPSENA
jgi:hypothetical protein